MSSFQRTAANSALENRPASFRPTSPPRALADELESLCTPYAESFLASIAHQRGAHSCHPHAFPPRASLQLRHSANAHYDVFSESPMKKTVAIEGSHSLAVPPPLARECSRMMEEMMVTTAAGCDGERRDVTTAARPLRVRPAAELEVENAYLRVLLGRLLHEVSAAAPPAANRGSEERDEEEPEVAVPASLLTSRRIVHDGDEELCRSHSRRSPSAAFPGDDTARHAHAAMTRPTFLGAAGHPREASPATTSQVEELQEQIELLREAVRELSRQASVVRATSSSPAPAEVRHPPAIHRAISPSPRCATPTCTTDVPTLQRIIVHQQQTIRTLQQEVEEAESSKTQMEKLLQLHSAAAVAPVDEDETACLAATTHWRSARNTEERTCGPTPPPPPPPLSAAEVVPATDGCSVAAEAGAAGSAAAGNEAALAEMYRLDYNAAAEAANERRRPATYGGARCQPWRDPRSPVEDEQIRLPEGDLADRSSAEAAMADDEPSSGMRTPLPRGTVLLRTSHLRFSSATGDGSSVAGAGPEESPVMQPSKASFELMSNRRTSAMDPFGAI